MPWLTRRAAQGAISASTAPKRPNRKRPMPVRSVRHSAQDASRVARSAATGRSNNPGALKRAVKSMGRKVAASGRPLLARRATRRAVSPASPSGHRLAIFQAACSTIAIVPAIGTPSISSTGTLPVGVSLARRAAVSGRARCTTVSGQRIPARRSASHAANEAPHKWRLPMIRDRPIIRPLQLRCLSAADGDTRGASARRPLPD